MGDYARALETDTEVQKAGMAVRIPIYSISEKSIRKAIKKVSSDAYINKAKTMQNIVRANDGVLKSVQLMNEFILKQQ